MSPNQQGSLAEGKPGRLAQPKHLQKGVFDFKVPLKEGLTVSAHCDDLEVENKKVVCEVPDNKSTSTI